MNPRIFPLEGVSNFRDFGDYPTEDGRRVIARRLFRAGHFATPTATDLQRLDALGVRVVADLRRDAERAKEPNIWPTDGAAQVIMDADGEIALAPPFIALLNQPRLTAGETRTFVTRTFREICFDPRYIRLFSAFFRAACVTDGAIVVHCSHGKDRTGLLCAITQLALGVSEQIVIADFELTNEALDLENRLAEAQVTFSERYSVRPSLEALRPMLGVEAGYLHAALDEIKKRCGSIEDYLDLLGVNASMRAQLRERYTHDPIASPSPPI